MCVRVMRGHLRLCPPPIINPACCLLPAGADGTTPNQSLLHKRYAKFCTGSLLRSALMWAHFSYDEGFLQGLGTRDTFAGALSDNGEGGGGGGLVVVVCIVLGRKQTWCLQELY